MEFQESKFYNLLLVSSRASKSSRNHPPSHLGLLQLLGLIIDLIGVVEPVHSDATAAAPALAEMLDASDVRVIRRTRRSEDATVPDLARKQDGSKRVKKKPKREGKSFISTICGGCMSLIETTIIVLKTGQGYLIIY